MSEFDANIFVDGQKTVATIPLDGGIVKDGGELDATCIVEDSNGKRHKAVKIVNVDDEPTIKSEINAQILNNNNELITVTEEQEGEIIPQNDSQIDFHCLVQKDEGEQLSVKTVELDGEIIKTGGAIDTSCIVQGSNGKKQLAVKVFKRGGGEIIETVSGNGSVDLPKAKANGLKSVKLFGGCEQSGTPTPTVPVDIVCNNGALKYSPNELNPAEIEIGYYRVQATGVLTESPYNFITGYMPVKPNQSYVFFGRRIEDNRLSSYNRIHWFDTNKEFISTNTYTKDTIGTGVAPANAYFAQCSCNESGATSRETTQEIVDGYNWVFEQATAEVPYIPFVEGGLYTDGTVETVAINLSDNLVDGQGTFVSPSAATTTRIYKAFGKLKAGTYRITVSSGFEFILQYKDTMEGSPTTYGNIGTWATDEEFEITDTSMFYGIAIRNEGGSGNIYPSTFYDANGKLLFYEVNETATAEKLLSVGDYKDVQSVLDGAVTRNIGVLVLDGVTTGKMFSSAWNATYKRCNLTIPDMLISVAATEDAICNLFPYSSSVNTSPTSLGFCTNNGYLLVSFIGMENITSANDANTWLASQYNAGTPAIVIYPLATPTAETVTPQVLQVQAGTNILQITQASIDNLPLEATYKRGK